MRITIESTEDSTNHAQYPKSIIEAKGDDHSLERTMEFVKAALRGYGFADESINKYFGGE